MRIGVIADTHIPDRAKEIPQKICEDFKKVDLILHAGDLIELKVLDEFKKIAEVKAVFGNMDSFSVVNSLPKKELIQIGKFKIGLIHGAGHPNRLMEVVRKEFDKVDCIVYGHAHNPVNEIKDGVLFFNPGSPTDKIFSAYNSYGILEINDTIKGEILKL